MMNNKIINIMLSTLMLTAVGCTEDAVYETPVEVGWTGYVSNISNDLLDGTKMVNVEDFTLIRDASLGALSHEWIIDKPECASFYTQVDDTSTTVASSVVNTKDAFIVFKDRGLVSVTLRNTFPKEVVANSVNQERSIYDEKLGVWVFEKKFEFDVYGDLRPDIIIERLFADDTAEELYNSAVDGWDEIRKISIDQMTDRLRLTYPNDAKAADHSTDQMWTVPTEGVVEGVTGGQTVVATFNEATTGEPITGFKLNVSRAENSNLKIPFKTIEMEIPVELTVNLISAAPAAPDSSVALAQNTEYIQVAFNKELQEIPANSTVKNDFKIANPTRAEADEVQIAIAEVKVSEEDKKILLVKPVSFSGSYSSAMLVYTPTDANDKIYTVEDEEKTTPATEFSMALTLPKFAPAETALRQQNDGWIAIEFSSAINGDNLDDVKDAFKVNSDVAIAEIKVSEDNANVLMIKPEAFDATGAESATLTFDPQDESDKIYDAVGVVYFSEMIEKSVELYQFAPISDQQLTQQADGWFSLEFTSAIKDGDYSGATDAFKFRVTKIGESTATEYGVSELKVDGAKLMIKPAGFSNWRVESVELSIDPQDENDRIYDSAGAVYMSKAYTNSDITLYFMMDTDLFSLTSTAGWWWKGMGGNYDTSKPYCNVESKDGNPCLFFSQEVKANAAELVFFGPAVKGEIERGVTYTFRCRIFHVTEGTTLDNKVAIYFSKSDENNLKYYYLNTPILVNDKSQITAGEWCDYSFDFTIPTGVTGVGATALTAADRIYLNKLKLVTVNWLVVPDQVATQFYIDDILIEKKATE